MSEEEDDKKDIEPKIDYSGRATKNKIPISFILISIGFIGLGFFIGSFGGAIIGLIAALFFGYFVLPDLGILEKVIEKSLWVIAVLILIFLIVMGSRCSASGTCEYYATSVKTTISNSAAARIASQIIPPDLIDAWKGKPPEQGSGFSFEEVEEKEEEFGVKVTSFKPSLKVYFVEEPIQIMADLTVKTPEDYDIILHFDNACESEDDKFKSSRTQPYLVYEDYEEQLSVACEFAEGYKEDIFKDEDPKKEIITKTVTFAPYYDFKQEVSLSIKTKQEKTKEDERDRAISITEGPLKLELFSMNSQPFYIGEINHIYVVLKNNKLVWHGNLKKLKQITLYVPPTIDLLSEGDNEKFCDFEKESSEDNYATYTLKSERLDKVNFDCSEYKWYTDFGSKQECLDQAKEEFRFTCKFKVTEAEEEIAFISPFKAEAEYTYGIRKTASIGILKPNTMIIEYK